MDMRYGYGYTNTHIYNIIYNTGASYAFQILTNKKQNIFTFHPVLLPIELFAQA